MENNYNHFNTPFDISITSEYLSFIKRIIYSSNIIILAADTACMGYMFSQMMKTIQPIVLQFNKQICFSYAGLKQLYDIAHDRLIGTTSKVSNKASNALTGIKIIEEQAELKLVDASTPRIRFFGKEEASDNLSVMRYISNKIWNNDILLLTQDVRFDIDVRSILGIRSFDTRHTAKVMRITAPTGCLDEFKKKYYNTNISKAVNNDKPRDNTPSADSTGDDVYIRYGLGLKGHLL